MGPTVWIAADTLGYSSGGGHRWAYLNWALGLIGIGCELVWLDRAEPACDPEVLEGLGASLRAFGVEQMSLCDPRGAGVPAAGLIALEEAERADLLLNLAYDVPAAVLERFPRSVMLDIDPGMTQTWIAAGDVEIAAHDVYLTIGEGVAAGTAPVPDCGLDWVYSPPCVALDAWPAVAPPENGAYTTVTHWWGDKDFVMPDGSLIDNSKRASFLQYLSVAADAGVRIDLAVAQDDLEDDASLLRAGGWTVSEPAAASGTLHGYQRYIADSRGEFSCAKPAYVALDTGWASDRSVCYLATGRPVIVQHTGPCRLLDEAQGQGVFRFADRAQAIEALRAVEADRPRQGELARAVAEEHFDARNGARRLLELCLP